MGSTSGITSDSGGGAGAAYCNAPGECFDAGGALIAQSSGSGAEPALPALPPAPPLSLRDASLYLHSIRGTLRYEARPFFSFGFWETGLRTYKEVPFSVGASVNGDRLEFPEGGSVLSVGEGLVFHCGVFWPFDDLEFDGFDIVYREGRLILRHATFPEALSYDLTDGLRERLRASGFEDFFFSSDGKLKGDYSFSEFKAVAEKIKIERQGKEEGGFLDKLFDWLWENLGLPFMEYEGGPATRLAVSLQSRGSAALSLDGRVPLPEGKSVSGIAVNAMKDPSMAFDLDLENRTLKRLSIPVGLGATYDRDGAHRSLAFSAELYASGLRFGKEGLFPLSCEGEEAHCLGLRGVLGEDGQPLLWGRFGFDSILDIGKDGLVFGRLPEDPLMSTMPEILPWQTDYAIDPSLLERLTDHVRIVSAYPIEVSHGGYNLPLSKKAFSQEHQLFIDRYDEATQLAEYQWYRAPAMSEGKDGHLPFDIEPVPDIAYTPSPALSAETERVIRHRVNSPYGSASPGILRDPYFFPPDLGEMAPLIDDILAGRFGIQDLEQVIINGCLNSCKGTPEPVGRYDWSDPRLLHRLYLAYREHRKVADENHREIRALMARHHVRRLDQLPEAVRKTKLAALDQKFLDGLDAIDQKYPEARGMRISAPLDSGDYLVIMVHETAQGKPRQDIVVRPVRDENGQWAYPQEVDLKALYLNGATLTPCTVSHDLEQVNPLFPTAVLGWDVVRPGMRADAEALWGKLRMRTADENTRLLGALNIFASPLPTLYGLPVIDGGSGGENGGGNTVDVLRGFGILEALKKHGLPSDQFPYTLHDLALFAALINDILTRNRNLMDGRDLTIVADRAQIVGALRLGKMLGEDMPAWVSFPAVSAERASRLREAADEACLTEDWQAADGPSACVWEGLEARALPQDEVSGTELNILSATKAGLFLAEGKSEELLARFGDYKIALEGVDRYHFEQWVGDGNEFNLSCRQIRVERGNEGDPDWQYFTLSGTAEEPLSFNMRVQGDRFILDNLAFSELAYADSERSMYVPALGRNAIKEVTLAVSKEGDLHLEGPSIPLVLRNVTLHTDIEDYHLSPHIENLSVKAIESEISLSSGGLKIEPRVGAQAGSAKIVVSSAGTFQSEYDLYKTLQRFSEESGEESHVKPGSVKAFTHLKAMASFEVERLDLDWSDGAIRLGPSDIANPTFMFDGSALFGAVIPPFQTLLFPFEELRSDRGPALVGCKLIRSEEWPSATLGGAPITALRFMNPYWKMGSPSTQNVVSLDMEELLLWEDEEGGLHAELVEPDGIVAVEDKVRGYRIHLGFGETGQEMAELRK